MMKCFRRGHHFRTFYDQVVGGLIARHVICKYCYTEYALWWHVEKPHKPAHKTIRIKIRRHEIF